MNRPDFDKIEQRIESLRLSANPNDWKAADTMQALYDENRLLRQAFLLGREMEFYEDGIDFKYKTVDEALDNLRKVEDEQD